MGTPGLRLKGHECLTSHCNGKSGKCLACGYNGMCCKKGVQVDGCDGIIGGHDRYECTEMPGKNFLRHVGKVLPLH